ncbi:MAG TPA: hypothetical protein VFD49_03620 [Candidatus Dormibacteraeota bacterium]|nr:hypothetical protein [Candidatus Dormibacteraeota bacterium]
MFDHEKGELVRLREFGSDSRAAVAAYAETEKELYGRPSMEIVLIGSDSLDTIEFTHANYFDGSVTVRSRYLVGP